MRRLNVMSPVLAVGMIALLAGCFETKTPLAPMDSAKVNKAFCGDWDLGTNANGESNGMLVVRNLNDKHYYVEVAKQGEDSMRMLGYIVDVKGTPIAHLRGLEKEGGYSEGWLLARVELVDGKLAFRQLNDEFFKEKPHDTVEKLRKLIEDNLNNDDMYDADTITGIKVEK